MVEGISTNSSFSLEKRIRYRLILAMLPLLLVLMFIIHKSIHLLIDEIIVERLQHDALSLISAIKKSEKGWQISGHSLPAVYERARSGHYYILQWKGGEIRSRSLWDKRVDPRSFIQGDTEDYLYFSIDSEFWVISEQPFVKSGEKFTLWVAEDISDIDKKQKTYEYILAIVLLVFTAVFILWQRSVLNRGFAILEPIQTALKDNQTSGKLDFPHEIPEEIRALVDSINILVERSSRQIARSRVSVGNLAHELKRPLQELRVIAIEMDNPEIQISLNHTIRQLQDRIDTELKRARISGTPVPGSLFTLKDELPVLQDLLTRIHGKQISFSSNTQIEQLPFDRDDILELIGNLLDNAWKYANTKVHLGITVKDNDFKIHIEDDGPGVPGEFLSEISQRGTRVDENSTCSGDGLGLSICQAIVDSYNGTLSFSNSEMGGLKVSITLNNALTE